MNPKASTAMALNRQPNIPEQDIFYAELIDAQRDLSDEQADMMIAKLALILCNHVGDRAVLAEAIALARGAEDNGYDVIIGAAGLAAHLSGVLAANTILPVIGVPCKGGALNGVDALYATVQMPTGIPVATVAIDGGANSAILACQMIALKSEELRKRLHDYKKELADSVEEKDKALQTKIAQM